MRLINRFFPPIPDEKAIARDVITSNINPMHIGPFGAEPVEIASSEKDKVIEWLSKAIRFTLKIPAYKEIAWDNRSEVKDTIASGLAYFSPKISIYNLRPGELFPAEFPNSPLVYLSYRALGLGGPYTAHQILINPNINDEIAVNVLTGFIAKTLKHCYPALYTDKTALTLLCMKRFIPDSPFALLPKDVIKIIAGHAKDENNQGSSLGK